MNVSVMVMNGLKIIGEVAVRGGHLDPGYIDLTINPYDEAEAHACICLSRDEAEAVAANITLALKHDDIRSNRT